ncbi:hypothetical protein GF351_00250 [Candidatus Woesearchaeota archaeon]|nr:hypothetical protein [Candidatus Woesearchaeota archaeon]
MIQTRPSAKRISTKTIGKLVTTLAIASLAAAASNSCATLSGSGPAPSYTGVGEDYANRNITRYERMRDRAGITDVGTYRPPADLGPKR